MSVHTLRWEATLSGYVLMFPIEALPEEVATAIDSKIAQASRAVIGDLWLRSGDLALKTMYDWATAYPQEPWSIKLK